MHVIANFRLHEGKTQSSLCFRHNTVWPPRIVTTCCVSESCVFLTPSLSFILSYFFPYLFLFRTKPRVGKSYSEQHEIKQHCQPTQAVHGLRVDRQMLHDSRGSYEGSGPDARRSASRNRVTSSFQCGWRFHHALRNHEFTKCTRFNATDSTAGTVRFPAQMK